ncbi:MAG: lipid II flippase MurJ [Candidatus Zixiibacteriota bacterium]
MSGTGSIKQAILGVSGIVLISKLLGFVREMVIAERFGTSLEYDIFLIAIAAPIFFNVVIVRATNFLLVPFLSGKINKTGETDSSRGTWGVINSLLAVVLFLILLIILLAPYLVRLIGPDLEGESLSNGIFYCRAISVLVLFGFAESMLRSALNVMKSFVYPAIGTIVLNIVAISTIYLFSGGLSVKAILLGLILGYFLQVIFLLIRVKYTGFFKNFRVQLFGPETVKVFSVGGAIIAVELLVSTYFLIDRYFASGLREGVVSALNYCSLLVNLPVSIIGFAIASVTFPYLSENSHIEGNSRFARVLHSALTLALVFGLPCGLFYLLFPQELTAAVFFRGAFDLYSLEITSKILITLAPYLVCLFVYTILIQACYSSGHQKTVFYVAVISVIMKGFLTWLLMGWMDYPGIGLATSIVQLFTVGMLSWILYHDGKLDEIKKLAVNIFKVVAASIPLLITGYYFKQLPDFNMDMDLISRFRVVPAGLISLVGFIIIGYLVKIEIVRDAVNKMTGRA